jgi:hypothetical protein
MKPRTFLLTGFGLGLVVVGYTTFVPEESPSAVRILGGAETDLIEHSEFARNVLFLVSAGLAVLAVIMAFLKPKLATALWGVILFTTLGRALLPSYPVQLFPFARAVFWLGLAVEFWLWHLARIALRAQAVPNPTLQRTPDSGQDCKPPAPGPAPLS